MSKKITKIMQERKAIPCCAYARVSSFKDEQETSFVAQESYWKEKLSSMPDRKFCGVFADQGISGFKVMQRKEYCKMIALAMDGFIKEIYTKSIYRFGRNATEALETIQKLREIGVAVIFEVEEINTLTCPSDMLLKLKAILAEQELKTMSSNLTFAFRKLFSEGVVPRTLTLGYDFDENNHMIVNEEEAKVVRLIYQLYLRGYGYNGIVRQLHMLGIPTAKGHEKWCQSTISTILSNERYIGDALLQKTHAVNGVNIKNNGELQQYYVSNDHEPIIDRETFQRVQREIEKRSHKQQKGQEHKTYPLTGKIECGRCGKHYRHKINSKIINFDSSQWICGTTAVFGKKECNSNTITESLLNEMVLDAYNEFIDSPYEIRNNTELTKRNKEIEILTNKIRRLYLDKLITYPQFKVEIEKLQKEQSEILNELRDCKILSLYKKPRMKLTEYTDEIVEKHIEKVVMDGYKITFVFRNGQKIVKEFKYENRRYCKNY